MKEIDYNIDNIKNGVNKLADAVLLTMGPNGNTVIITDDFGRPYPTKDGVSVANDITFKNPTEDAVATLLKQTAQQTVKEAGDGTTTSICLAQAFINEGFKLLENGTPITEVQEQLDYLLKDVTNYLDNTKKELNKEDILYVAKIASNNDEDIARIIDEAYKHSNNVKVVETSQSKTYIDNITGVNLNTPYFDPSFINNERNQSIEYNEKMPIILVDGHLESIDNIFPIVKGLEAVTIVADHFPKQVLYMLKDNYNKDRLTIALIKSPGMAGHRKNVMRDLATYFNIKLIDPTRKLGIKENPQDYIGYTDTLYSDKEKTILYNAEADVTNLIDDLKHLKEKEEDILFKNLIQERIDNISGNMSIIKVGGDSPAEIKEKKDRMDDAVLSVKCALEEGIVEGGGRALVGAAFSLMKPDRTYLIEALNTPYKIIFKENNIDIINIEDFFEKKIIDPVKVTKTALKNAVSVAKVILSTKAVVLNPRLWS